jgi:hypothetical protein
MMLDHTIDLMATDSTGPIKYKVNKDNKLTSEYKIIKNIYLD